ncbi:hypothetical protein HMPREF0653_00794 [Prevotella disiens JCM 6334 = ATCC 29426]|uniref:Uncharacterized protein n=1 Tax=Prevotella disiens JCM 6334 = ATCC 29426 TaxID=1235811 RepID=A0ABP2YCF6_9BACT|nr:hypothetical protein HMPREF0653_00794 [Prevotella disiens JCM 6334 = ATCC 29426]
MKSAFSFSVPNQLLSYFNLCLKIWILLILWLRIPNFWTKKSLD